MRRHGRMGLIIALLVLVGGQISPLQALTMDEAVESALQGNRELQALREHVKIAQARLLTARQYPVNPGVEVTWATDQLSGDEGERLFSLSLSQEIEVAGQKRLREEATTVDVEIARMEIRDKERLIRAQVKEIFHTLLHLQKRLEFEERVVSLNTQLLTTAQARFTEGDVPALDVTLTKVGVNRAINSKILIEMDRRVGIQRLNELIGRPWDAELTVQGEIRFVPIRGTSPQFVLEKLQEVALEHRPDLQVVTFLEKKAVVQTSLARRERIPNLTVSFFYDRSRTAIADLTDRDQLIGIRMGLSLPIFNRRQGIIQETSAEGEKVKRQREGLVFAITREVASAYEKVTRTQSVLTLFEEAILMQSQENLDLIRTAYELGEVGIPLLLQEQERFIGTNLSYLTALFEYHASLIELERAMGRALPEGGM